MNLQKKRSFDVSNLNQKNGQETRVDKSNTSVYKGLFYAGLSGALFATCALLVKNIKSLPTEQVTLIPFVGIFLFSLPKAARYHGNILGPKECRYAIFIRSIFIASYVMLSYTTFRLLPIGEASVIILSSPALIAVFAKLFLKEPCGVFQSFILVLTIISICFIAKLPAVFENNLHVFSKETTYGLLAGIGAVFLYSFQQILVRKLKNVHYVVMNFNLGLISILEIAIIIAVSGHFKWPECGIQRWLIILLAGLSYFGQILITIALQTELATPVSLVKSSVEIIVSFIMQAFFFQDIPDKYGIIGAIFIVISFILSGIKKWASSIELDSPKFKYLKALLD